MRVGEEFSSSGYIVSGLPRESILGPLLFYICTFYIFNVPNLHLQSYGNDTQLLYFFDSFEPIATSFHILELMMRA